MKPSRAIWIKRRAPRVAAVVGGLLAANMITPNVP